ncbi:50S ribosomal protein L11 methyltransferase [Porphyromonas sp.]|uniref:50S ribosomal protein L11 methyltransferase n=1 Tax=Porphyromonas sp. TaxID=1924944 RepID=UPI0026DABA99|nr:50S ribosomal protein L11 methyltransferase [Porphyromonas sp.]MDO4695535.1 50S ribosomal protein L11 methyltransferase [Porphyromonas sp.]MDO4771863.1 50S ribosomal protein L11 methyltransferase [Porphyromonas sp.]
MKYLECSFTFPHEAEGSEHEIRHDVLSYYLGEEGFDSFESEPDALLAYIPVSAFDEAKMRAMLESAYDEDDRPSFTVREMEDKNWNEEWERNYFRPLRIDDVTIRATFHTDPVETPMEIIIDPKMAFGTGNHATTASMLRLIKAVGPRGLSVIDMGCGSGILGIYAMKLGAASCIAIDFDEWSVRNATDNAELNKITLDVRHGDASALEGCPVVDLFVANINRNIILNDLETYLRHLKPEGTLLLSGFYIDDVPMIQEALDKHGRKVERVLEDNRWVGLLCR